MGARERARKLQAKELARIAQAVYGAKEHVTQTATPWFTGFTGFDDKHTPTQETKSVTKFKLDPAKVKDIFSTWGNGASGCAGGASGTTGTVGAKSREEPTTQLLNPKTNLPFLKPGQVWRERRGSTVTLSVSDHAANGFAVVGDNSLQYSNILGQRCAHGAYLVMNHNNHPQDLVELVSDVATDTTTSKPKLLPLEVGQVWKRRDGQLREIVLNDGFVGGVKTGRESCRFGARERGRKDVGHICYGAFYQGDRENPAAWHNSAFSVNADDLVQLVTNADGTPADSTESEKESVPTATATAATTTAAARAASTADQAAAKPVGALEERVVQLIKAHAPTANVDMAKVKEAVLQISTAQLAVLKDYVDAKTKDSAPPTVTFSIPDLKVTHTEDNVHEQFPTLLELIANGERVFLSGPPGSGKTTATEKAAEILKRPFFIQGPVADEFRLTGFIDAHGNFQETEVYRWATTKDAVLMLDEVDGSFPQPLLFLNMALANGYIAFPGKGKVEIPKGNTVVANGNTWGGGADFDFVGRSKLDAAFVNRFPAKLVWDYDHKFELALAKSANGGKANWVKVMVKIRENARKNGIKVHVTPRDTFYYCRCRARGWSHERALATGLLATCKPDQRTKLLEGVKDDA